MRLKTDTKNINKMVQMLKNVRSKRIVQEKLLEKVLSRNIEKKDSFTVVEETLKKIKDHVDNPILDRVPGGIDGISVDVWNAIPSEVNFLLQSKVERFFF